MSYTIALIYERKQDYLAKGFSLDQTEDLWVESDTIDAITSTLESLGHTVTQVGDIKDLVACLATNRHGLWDLVFSLSVGLHGLLREVQVPALLEAYQIPFIGADAASSAFSHNKANTKLILEHASIPTAPWCLVRDTRDLETSDRSKAIAVAMSSSPHADALTTYPLFAKPVAEASSIGIYPSSKIERRSELEPMVSFLNARSPDQDILIESYLAGREFTVGILGTGARARILGVLEFRFDRRPDGDEIGQGGKEVDFFTIELKKTWEPVEGVYVENLTPDMASDPEVQVVCERALQAYTTLGCRDYGRIDVRSDRKGPGAIPCIIEVNPRPGLRPNWSHLTEIANIHGCSFERLMDQIINSAAERLVRT